MRKFISMGVMALLLSVMATTAMAGNVDDCDTELKFADVSKGLYGLCIAWHNADSDNAKASIERAYAKKANGPNDPLIIPGSKPIGTTCPCLDMLESTNLDDWDKILDWGASLFGCYSEVVEEFVVDEASFMNVDLLEYEGALLTYFKVKSDGEISECQISQYEAEAQTGHDFASPITVEEYGVCFEELQNRCPTSF